MKYLLIRERLRRKCFKSLETSFLALKFIIHNQKLSNSLRWEASLLLSKFSKTSRITLKNRCFLTGRARSYSRFFNLSRIQFRNLARNDFLPFVEKFSW
jgi:small subunit ribosomal protein S14